MRLALMVSTLLLGCSPRPFPEKFYFGAATAGFQVDPGCPSGPEIMGDAERQLKAIPGVGTVTINLVWTPFWSPDRIEPRVRAYMGL